MLFFIVLAGGLKVQFLFVASAFFFSRFASFEASGIIRRLSVPRTDPDLR